MSFSTKDTIKILTGIVFIALAVFPHSRVLLVQMFPSKDMHLWINIFLILTLFVGPFVFLYRTFEHKEKIDKNPMRLPLIFIFAGAILSLPVIKYSKSYYLWWIGYLTLFFSSEIFMLSTENMLGVISFIFPFYIIISALLLLTPFYFRNPVISMWVARYSGIFMGPNELGVFAALSFFLFLGVYFFYKNKLVKITSLVFMIIAFVAMGRSVSRNAFLSFAIAVWFFLIMHFIRVGKRKGEIYTLMSISISSLVFVASAVFVILKSSLLAMRMESVFSGDISFFLRVLMAKYTIKFLFHNVIHFFLGAGPAQFFLYPFSFGLDSPHNIILHFWIGEGLLGFFGIILLFYRTFVIELKRLLMDIGSNRLFYFKLSVLSAIVAFWISGSADVVYWKVFHPYLLYTLAPLLIITYRLFYISESSIEHSKFLGML